MECLRIVTDFPVRRGNISNALTDTITKDLAITSDDVNLGNQLMLAGIVVSELPSNMLLQKVGAPIWLTGQMGIWGTVALAQAWVTDKTSFFATRFILGVSKEAMSLEGNTCCRCSTPERNSRCGPRSSTSATTLQPPRDL
jgi:hypothetical protein